MSNTEKTILIVTNNRSQGIEFLNIIKELYYSLPFYLKPGVSTWNDSSITFDNCVKIVTTSNINSLGLQVNCLIINDAAHIKKFDILYRTLFPTITALRNTKMIISSTPNGNNHFYNLVCRVKSGDTSFNLTEIPYTVISGRDERWREEMIKSIGSIEYFKQEYELWFGDSIDLVSTLKRRKFIIDELNKLTESISTETGGELEKIKKTYKKIKRKLK